MRKWLAVVLFAVMLTVGASALAVTADEVTGVWYLRHLTVMGVNASAESMGLTMTMTLSPDGAATLEGNLLSVDPKARWLLDGATLRVDEMAFACRDGQLTAETNSGGMQLTLVMTREPASVAGDGDAPVHALAQMEDFCGAWQAVSVCLSDVTVPLTDSVMRLDIEAASVSVTSDRDTSVLPVLALADGRLMFGAEKAAIMTAALMEDGTLRLLQDGGSIVFDKLPAQETAPEATPDAAEDGAVG